MRVEPGSKGAILEVFLDGTQPEMTQDASSDSNGLKLDEVR